LEAVFGQILLITKQAQTQGNNNHPFPNPIEIYSFNVNDPQLSLCNNDNVGNNQYHKDILYSNQG